MRQAVLIGEASTGSFEGAAAVWRDRRAKLAANSPVSATLVSLKGFRVARFIGFIHNSLLSARIDSVWWGRTYDPQKGPRKWLDPCYRGC